MLFLACLPFTLSAALPSSAQKPVERGLSRLPTVESYPRSASNVTWTNSSRIAITAEDQASEGRLLEVDVGPTPVCPQSLVRGTLD